MNAPIGSRASANPVIDTAKSAKPNRIRRRLSQSTKTVPTERPPRQAPSPHVAYSQLYCGDCSTMPKLSRAIAGNSPTYGRHSSENVVSVRRIRDDTALALTSRMPEVSSRRPVSCGHCCRGRKVHRGQCGDDEQVRDGVDEEELRRRDTQHAEPGDDDRADDS